MFPKCNFLKFPIDQYNLNSLPPPPKGDSINLGHWNFITTSGSTGCSCFEVSLYSPTHLMTNGLINDSNARTILQVYVPFCSMANLSCCKHLHMTDTWTNELQQWMNKNQELMVGTGRHLGWLAQCNVTLCRNIPRTFHSFRDKSLHLALLGNWWYTYRGMYLS